MLLHEEDNKKGTGVNSTTIQFSPTDLARAASCCAGLKCSRGTPQQVAKHVVSFLDFLAGSEVGYIFYLNLADVENWDTDLGYISVGIAGVGVIVSKLVCTPFGQFVTNRAVEELGMINFGVNVVQSAISAKLPATVVAAVLVSMVSVSKTVLDIKSSDSNCSVGTRFALNSIYDFITGAGVTSYLVDLVNSFPANPIIPPYVSFIAGGGYMLARKFLQCCQVSDNTLTRVRAHSGERNLEIGVRSLGDGQFFLILMLQIATSISRSDNVNNVVFGFMLALSVFRLFTAIYGRAYRFNNPPNLDGNRYLLKCSVPEEQRAQTTALLTMRDDEEQGSEEDADSSEEATFQ